MMKPIVLRLIFLITLACVLPACRCQSIDKFRMGINPWPGYELLWLAQVKGFYREEGLEVDLVEYSSLVDAQTAMGRGHLDVLCSTIVEVLLITLPDGTAPQVIMVPDYSKGADVILANKDLVPDIRALKGKTIGLELGSLGQYMLTRALQQNQLQPGDVTVNGMDQLRLSEALQSDKIQAAISYPPVSVEILRQGKAHVIYSSNDLPGEILDAVSASPQTLQRISDLGPRMRRVWDRALKYLQEHPQESIEIMAAHEKISTEEFRLALEGIELLPAQRQEYYYFTQGKLKEILSAVQKIMQDAGTIHELRPVDNFLPK